MDVYSWDFNMFDYGSQLRRCRRLFHEFLGPHATSRFDNYLNKHTRRFLSRLAETPDDFLAHIRLSVLPRSRHRMSRTYSQSLVSPGLLSWK